ncbi:MAG: STAS domain-containing protein [Melioribacteraceae bacterium]|nr:STAS domain-containing protein [Melioribacteraceae bacterium]
MEIIIDKTETLTEIKLAGRLDSNTSQKLETELIDLINSSSENILVNLDELNYISSSGLRVFLLAAKSLDTKGMRLKLCGMKNYIKEVFDIAGFSSIFDIYESKQKVNSEV